jgi:arginine-tRNA-protein transferase
LEQTPIASQEQFDIFAAYQESRHSHGDMAKMDFRDYQALIEDTPVESSLVEFRDQDQTLLAACLMDRVDNGLSAVYSFFDPQRHRDSLGTLMVLWMIDKARALGLEYVYLGFWIADCSKMSYKSKFQPMETLSPEGWHIQGEQ